MLLLIVSSHGLEATIEYACQLSGDMPKGGAFPHTPCNQALVEAIEGCCVIRRCQVHKRHLPEDISQTPCAVIGKTAVVNGGTGLFDFRVPARISPKLTIIAETVNRTNHADEGRCPERAFDGKTRND